MHFSIPDTQEFVDGVNNTYVGYNIHINGLFHCTVRYKQLHNLHEQLVKELEISLPSFPPKKFFPLTAEQQKERRLSLERYIQSIGQNTLVNRSDLLYGFLLNAQQETVGDSLHNENLDVYFPDNSKVTLQLSQGEHSGQVFKKVCQRIQLSEKYHPYFALFIIQAKEGNNIHILRILQNFESPLITYKTIDLINTRVILLKNYWDIRYDVSLSDDPVALNLLYTQAVSEIQRKWILVPNNLEFNLEELKNNGNKREYLNIARTLKYYGYKQFIPCFCDYPRPNSRALVSIGRNELNFRILLVDKEQEVSFKVTRIRCWRITTLQNETEEDEENVFTLKMSFEYLLMKNQLQLITLSSEQAIVMSMFLQSMINELISQNLGISYKIQEKNDAEGKTWTYIMRDGHSRIEIGSSPINNITKTNVKPEPIVKKIASKLSAAKTKKNNEIKIIRKSTRDGDIMENNAFHVIGDDDL